MSQLGILERSLGGRGRNGRIRIGKGEIVHRIEITKRVTRRLQLRHGEIKEELIKIGNRNECIINPQRKERKSSDSGDSRSVS